MSDYVKLRAVDVKRVVLALPSDVRELFIGNRLFLGGGFIRSTISGEPTNDIDLFGEGLISVAGTLAEKRGVEYLATLNAYTVLTPGRLPVQFVHRWEYSEPEALLDGFDFTVAKTVVWYEDGVWKSLAHPDFYADLAAKRLVYGGGPGTAGGSLLRMRKFLSRGYRIDIESLSTLVGDLTGRDNTMIARELYEVDPLRVVDSFEAVVIDEHIHIVTEESQP